MEVPLLDPSQQASNQLFELCDPDPSENLVESLCSESNCKCCDCKGFCCCAQFSDHGANSLLTNKRAASEEFGVASPKKKLKTDELYEICDGSLFPVLGALPGHMTDGCDSSERESVYSIQSKITAIVKDSSDDLWFLEEDAEVDRFSDVVYADEFEIASNCYSDSDGDRADILSSPEAVIVICDESDLDCFADCEWSGFDESSDEDLLPGDKWFCLICEHSNGPLHRFCESCWTLRPNWLPRPPPKVPVLDKTEREFAENHQVPTTSAAGERAATANCSRHGASESGDNQQSSSTSANSLATCSQSSIRDDSFTSQEILDSQDSGVASLASASSAESTSRKGADFDKTQGCIGPVDNCVQDLQHSNSSATLISPLTSCIICFSHPKEATIVHGKTGHQCCCYQCACRLKRRKRPCPVCRRDIQKVIRNYPV